MNGLEINLSDNTLVGCLRELVENDYLENHLIPTLGIFVNANESMENTWIFNDIIDRFLAKTNNVSQVDLSGVSTLNHLIQNNILFVDSAKAFNRLVERIRRQSWDSTGAYQKYFVVLSNVQHNKLTIVREILQMCLEKLIAAINVIVEDQQPIINVYTYFPFTPTSCRNSRPVIYNRFVNGQLEWKKSTFPRKTRNLWKCTLKAIIWDTHPFINIGKKDIEGIEVALINAFADTMNFTIKWVISPNKRGDISGNGSLENAYKMLGEGEGDFNFAGNLCTPRRRTFLASTKEYFTSTLNILLKSPKSYSSLELLLIPFELSTWPNLQTHSSVSSHKWFQQNGATEYTAKDAMNLLREALTQKLISRFGEIQWPPRSPDLTPLNCFVCGQLKEKVKSYNNAIE
ncbi:uncharacterized protein LOC129951360 [Eupeodes corollae]|uniref:uncharacterized protein LOC129951360 n=1 Tax=Eupeodes corollae TaxID=290404 RepID=UPI0024932CEA|nr:uncharacterized protein LOC129951360 [Eupeodes corollae]